MILIDEWGCDIDHDWAQRKGWKGYPTDENIYDFYSRGIIGVIVHGHVINKFI